MATIKSNSLGKSLASESASC